MKIYLHRKLLHFKFGRFKLMLKPFFYVVIWHCTVDSIGIEFQRDSLIWVWPWKWYMNNDMAWYSQTFEAAFKSRKDEQKAFDDYIVALKTHYEREKVNDYWEGN